MCNFGMSITLRYSNCVIEAHTARQQNSDDVESLVYMIQDGYYNSNIDTENIIYLLADQDAEDFMGTPSTFHMREYYALKSQSQDYEAPMYMEALSGEYME